jgi:LmbE family N-acetylglucosaminyl deacetylase
MLCTVTPTRWDRRALLEAAQGWDRLLGDCPSWTPPDGDLLVVAPHPDDEVLGAGGLIRAWAARGAKVSVLSVSDGEAAANPEPQVLGNVRREELNEALRKLCPTHIAVTRLGLPDGRITQHLNRLRNALLTLASGPLTMVAPYEHDGHPDHEAVGNLCVEFARSWQIPLARYAIRTWQRAAPENLGGARWVRFVLGLDARRAKGRALRCFKSQIDPCWGDAAVTAATLRDLERPYEAFLL